MIPPLSEALAERGFDTLTPVQQAVTADDVAEADLLVSAQTGSGKTVGFGLAIAPTLLGDNDSFGPAGTPTALVVAPTRELAFQVMQELRWLYARTGALVNACVGGMDIRQERRLLERGTHIVVGTPGRLCDHIRRGALDLSDIRAVVLDEADEMLDLGFREDLEFILQSAPVERRTLLFSATVSPVIAKLAEQFQRDARRINTIDKAQQHADITYQALRVAAGNEDHAIFNLLRLHGDQGAIVFANTRAQVNHLTTRFANRGLPVVSLSGELSQSERSHALQAMRDGRARICVATDVAARGIDLPNLALVIHADLPSNTESLLHRSGRTGRAGRKGISALIVPPKMVKRAERLLKWAKISAVWGVPPSAEDILRYDEDQLLNDPAWTEDLSAEQAGFAARLLERYSPEQVAAAVWRLHQARHAAPEELDNPDAPAPRREARSFGPSRWFSLSVGRASKAEPRWLLPLILRATDLEKAAIGAIRVQDDETHVEIAEASVETFTAALGTDGALADGIHAQPMDAPPERPARKPAGADRRDRPDRPDRKRPNGKPQDRPPHRSQSPRSAAPSDKTGAPKTEIRTEAAAEPKTAEHKRASDKPIRDTGTPVRKSSEGAQKPRKPADKPKPAKPHKTGGKDAAARGGPSFGKSKDKPGGKPHGKPGAKPKGKPSFKGEKRPDAPRGASAGKAPRGFDPKNPSASGKPRGARGAKPGSMPRGGDAMPRRKG